MNKIWLGSIFLKEEDGYKIILKSLEHYKKRLRTINSSPELADAAMFSQIIQQEAIKTYPKIDELITKIPQCLENTEQLNLLEQDLAFFIKALESYKSDITKAQTTSHEYYQKLVDVSKLDNNEVTIIDNAITKIQSYSE